MRVRRSRLTADFVQVPNRTARDECLSYMARGILAELLSRPDGWEATADDLWRLAGQARGKAAESRRTFRAAFAELKSAGYLVASRERLDGGRFGTVLTVYDVPQTDVPTVGTSVRTGETPKAAGQTGVPSGMPQSQTDVPPVGTPERPGQTDVSAGRADVPDGGMPDRAGQTHVSAAHTDVPPVGTSNKKTDLENGEENVSISATGRKIVSAVGATPEEAREIISLIKEKKNPDNLGGYVNAIIGNGDMPGWLDQVRAAARKFAARLAVDNLGEYPPCPHGVAGGDQPRPDTGRPFCPICRNGARTTPPRWEPAPEPPKLRVINADGPAIPEPSPRPEEPRDDVQAARDYLNRRGDYFEWVAKARAQLGAEAPRDEVFLLAAELAQAS